ncbi:TIGR03016 family PEP-CTERM system-associated outer membrane protein [Massilia endophytica]|uniref:TIGR03016 family PEP-CTERM system-associated outer membrane protein n=1 Tax=Massilia endophytica TaxID=2899220 RepID=UPI001E65DBB2|nr:TIGR03016 family PEP-CTERM system-associated outer membrane protein [Massilia endophytica]UGQ46217.1 TIGR03016 family PEP-CTERM system-associated outer membrane protein [Massilia endophytica]
MAELNVLPLSVRKAWIGPAIAALVLAPQARAEWRFTPALTGRLSYSDNVNLRPDGQGTGQFVTEIAPSIVISDQTPRFRFNAAYQVHIYEYARDRVSGTDRTTQQLQAGAFGELLSDLLFVDASASVSQAPVTPLAAGFGNGFARDNRNEVRSYRVSPWIHRTFGAFASANLRYAHDMVGSDNAGFGRSTADTLNLAVNSGAAFQRAGWSVSLSKQHLEDSVAPPSSSQGAGVSLRYVVTPELTWTLGGGYDKFDYEGLGSDTQGASWSTGLIWNPSPRTSLTLSGGRRYYGNSYFLSGSHRSRYTVWNISYSDDVTTTRSQFLLPSAVDTAAMLDRLFIPAYPDPVLRAIAVEAYIRASGLPRSLPDSVNYFTNRYMLQRQGQASVGLRLPRTTVLVSAFSTRREALSLFQADSALLGSSGARINDNVRQRGLTVVADYALTARSNLSLAASVNTTRSGALEREAQHKSARVFFSHRIAPHLNGTVELRTLRTRSAFDARTVKEHAVAASLSATF